MENQWCYGRKHSFYEGPNKWKITGQACANATRNEWVQRRKNKYQRDSRGYIIDEAGSGDVTNTQELKEKKGKELTGKADDVGNEKSNVPVRTSNMFALLEQGEIEATMISENPNLGDVYTLQFKAIQEAIRTKELNDGVLKDATNRAHDQIDFPTKKGISETGHNNNAIQIAAPTIDDPGLSAGKTFGVTSGILANGVLINNRGQKKLGMIAKNYEPK
ncbi:hypothetical protein A4A49_19194 [Nicotiana attenuata]|uniref:Uncharacterized protein n=1 Tax=Nicotiana attenuata TaxID=49451 RepID=A0A1J6IQY9_NICAT|nr:hypothetical protein A4A49_19194 [Nicotiana attenuata]